MEPNKDAKLSHRLIKLVEATKTEQSKSKFEETRISPRFMDSPPEEIATTLNPSNLMSVKSTIVQNVEDESPVDLILYR